MSDSKPLTLSDSRMVAEFVRQQEFQGLFEKRFAVPPDYVALLFRNGEFVDAYKGGHFSVGGLVNKLKSFVGGSSHIAMLIADLKPFTLEMGFNSPSADKIEVAGVATIEMQVNPDKPANILGLMHGVSRAPAQGGGESDAEYRGKKDDKDKKKDDEFKQLGRLALSKNDILNRFAPHLVERVFAQAISRMDANDVRGNVGLQDKIQADLMKVIEEFAGRLGLIVNGVSVQFARNAAEQAEFEKAEVERQLDAAEFQMEQAKRAMEMEADATRFAMEIAMDNFRLEQASEEEIKLMALQGEIRFIDARETEARRQELEALAHEVDVLNAERVAKAADELSRIGHAADMSQAEFKLAKIRNEIADFEFKAGLARQELAAMSSIRVDDATFKSKHGQQIAEDDRQFGNISRLSKLEQDMEDREAKRRTDELNAGSFRNIGEKKADADAFATRAKAVERMERDQIMALGAMLSPDVAAVLAQEAKERASSQDDAMAQMRDMVAAAQAANVQSGEQAMRMLTIAMDGGARIAAGSGGKGDPGPSAEAGGAVKGTIECSKCGRENEAKNRFCIGCGKQLRS